MTVQKPNILQDIIGRNGHWRVMDTIFLKWLQ